VHGGVGGGGYDAVVDAGDPRGAAGAADAFDDGEDGGAFGRGERRRFGGGAEGEQAGGAGVEEFVGEGFPGRAGRRRRRW
jgi:hypothetical protein